jgi:hypothetical protein
MGSKKTIAIILIVLALGLLGYWVGNGTPMFTQTEVMTQVEVKDEIFGTTEIKEEWRDEFRPGLDLIGPTAAVLLLAAGWLFWSASKDRRRLAPSH